MFWSWFPLNTFLINTSDSYPFLFVVYGCQRSADVFFLLMCTWLLQLIPMTNLMNVSCSCLSNLSLYLPELEVRRFNYLMSPLPSCLSLRRVKIDRHCESLDSNLLLRIMRMDDFMRCQWIFLLDWRLNSSLYRNLLHFVTFWAPSAAIRWWQCLDKSHKLSSSELQWAQ